MNDEKLRTARTNLYLRMASRLIKALTPFIGAKPDNRELARVSRPYVVAAREQAQTIAYRDYLKFVNNENPVPKMELNRFTEELWNSSIESLTEDVDVFGADQVEGLAMKADYWARDAEWGQRVDVAKKDDRIEKIARVDFKPPTCPFCTLLNSRGAVYLSLESGARTLHDGDTCTLIWVRKGETDYPGHESSAEALRRYEAAKDKLGASANTTTILRELKAQNPDSPEGSVKKNVRTAVEQATKSQISSTKTKISTLERLNPKSDSARKYRDDELARNRDLLRALEGTKE